MKNINQSQTQDIKMPRFEPDFENTRASIRTFERGEYEVKITKAEPFAYIRERDSADVAGCQFNLEMVGKLDAKGKVTDEFAGETVTPIKVYVHSKGAWGMAKQFLMAAFGYKRDEEDKFNKEVASKEDFSLEGEGEDITAGDGWEKPVGRHVVMTLDKRMWTPQDGEPQEQQDHKGYRPAS